MLPLSDALNCDSLDGQRKAKHTPRRDRETVRIASAYASTLASYGIALRVVTQLPGLCSVNTIHINFNSLAKSHMYLVVKSSFAISGISLYADRF
jgi:hypothetical protein